MMINLSVCWALPVLVRGALLVDEGIFLLASEAVGMVVDDEDEKDDDERGKGAGTDKGI